MSVRPSWLLVVRSCCLAEFRPILQRCLPDRQRVRLLHLPQREAGSIAALMIPPSQDSAGVARRADFLSKFLYRHLAFRPQCPRDFEIAVVQTWRLVDFAGERHGCWRLSPMRVDHQVEISKTVRAEFV